MLGAGLINMFKVSITAVLNSISAWWHMVGVARDRDRPRRSFPTTTSRSLRLHADGQQHRLLGGANARLDLLYVFLTGLLLAQYTITGYDASAHMSEETRNASLGAAWGMVMSVVVSVVFGFILLVAVTFAIPAKGRRDTSAFIVQHIWQDSMGTRWAEFLLFIAVRRADLLHDRVDDVGVADDVRLLARPRGARHQALAEGVEARPDPGQHRVGDRRPRRSCTPLPALWWGYVGYAASTAVAVIGLYIAFVLPIILRLRAGDSFERGAWHLGKHYKWIDSLAILWIVFICIVFMLPTFQGGDPVPVELPLVGLSTTRRCRWSARSSCSAAGTCCRRASGSRDRSGRAPRRSSSRSRPASRRRESRRPRPRARRSHSVERRAGFGPPAVSLRGCTG